MKRLQETTQHIYKYLLVPQHFFVVTAILFGLPILVLRPAYDIPDFGAHLLRSYSVSTGHFLADKLNNAEVYNSQAGITAGNTSYMQVGSPIPKSVAWMSNLYSTNETANRGPNVVSGRGQFKLYSTKESKSPTVKMEYNTVAVYNPVSYLPQAIALFAGRVLGLSLYASVLLASALNFLLWLIAIRIAIKVSPIGKWLIVALNLLPMTVFLAPSISPDVLLISSVFLFFAYFFRLVKEKGHITVRQLLPLIALAILMAMLKQTYFILALAMVVFVRRFRTKRHALVGMLLSVGLPLLVVGAWMIVLAKLNFTIEPWSQPHIQESFILHHPLVVIKTAAKTILFNSDGAVWSFFGVLGWLSIPIPLIAVVSLAIGLTLSAGLDEETLDLPFQHKFILASVLLMNIVLILGSLFVYWTAVGSKTLDGIQGRYFIPLAVFVAPLINGSYRISPKGRTRVVLMMQFIMVASLAVTMGVLYRAYYQA